MARMNRNGQQPTHGATNSNKKEELRSLCVIRLRVQ